MCGSMWKCSQLQCKLATTEESRGLEIQNPLLDDMKAEFQEFQRRQRESVPPVDAERPPEAPRAAEEEEDKISPKKRVNMCEVRKPSRLSTQRTTKNGVCDRNFLRISRQRDN